MNGETETSPTLIAENLVIAGFGGDEFAARGRITAYDLDTGKTVWTCHATGSDKDVCLTPDTNKAHPEYGTYGKDLGISTYPADDWKIGGGTFWGFFSYDPELKLVYASTGNPGLWSPVLSLRRQNPRGVQHRQVGQQMVDDHLRPQGRHR